MNRFTTLIALAGAFCGPLAATAQLAPPPPPPVDHPPVVFPPPPPPPRPAQAAPRPRGMPVKPNFEFQKLAEFDAEGNLKPMLESPEYLALVRNPKIRAEQIPAIREALDTHFARVDDLVVDNVDLVMEAVGGLFEEADLNDPHNFNEIQGIMQVLMTSRGLADHLAKEDAIDDEQKAASQAIFADWVQTYNKEALDKAIEEHGEENKKDIGIDMGRAMFHLLSIEALLSYRRMALQIGGNFDAVIEAAGLDDADGVTEARKAVAAADGDEERYQAVKKFMLDLGFRDQQKLLEANREMAPKRTYPELEQIADGG
jgi:hypothetical protein